MSHPLLRIRDLQVRLGDPRRPVRAVDGIDLDLYPGETLALLGESGCGKSMTAFGVMRLLPPSGRVTAGQVLLGDQDLLRLPECEMRAVRGGQLGMIFQEPMTSLNPVMRIGDQIAESIRLHDPAHAAAPRARAVELLDAVGIPDPARRIDEYPHQLSGGMKQRVMVAIALAGRPRLLIADEPTTALDVTIQAQVLGLLKKLQRDHELAVLLISHDLGVVAETADRIAVMYAGQLVEVCDRQTFFKGPAHPYARKLFSALPGFDKRGRRLEIIPGMVPPLDTRFSACRFADRCDHAAEDCRQQPPPWRDLGNGHRVRCLHPRSGLVESAAAASRGEETRAAKTLLEVRDLKVHFPIHKGVLRRVKGHVKAVDGVSLRIGGARTLALVGESGCGKTTVGKGILRLIEPSAGQVLFDGEDLARLSPRALRRRRADMQIIFQDPAASMNPRMPVGEIVAEGLRAQGIGTGREDRQRRVARLLEQVGLPADSAARYPHEFSGGQRQRICIARALAVDPRLIVCDEPTSALDVSVQAQILNLFGELQQRLSLSYLFITHDISVVSFIAHEVAVMYLGRVVEQGSVEQVLERPAHPYTEALLSAVPVVDPASRRQIIRLEGDMPSPADPPRGCHFHPRCPRAMAVCRTAYPETTELEPGHQAACWLLTEKRW